MSSSHISELVPEVLLNIFSYLSPSSVGLCGRVCRPWREIAAKPQIWKDFATQLIPFFDKEELTEGENLKSRVIQVILSAKQQTGTPAFERWRLELYDSWIIYFRIESIVMSRTASPFLEIIRKKRERVIGEKKREEAEKTLSQVGEKAIKIMRRSR